MKSYLRLEPKAEEELTPQIISEGGLARLLDDLYDGIGENAAVEIHIYRKFVLVGTRERGHGDKMVKKFTNLGFSVEPNERKAASLAYAIRAIDDGTLPEYCYMAINGDIGALRQTTAHLVRAYDAKVRRMREKGKPAIEIEPFIARRDAAARRLEFSDDELVEVSEPIIVEIPKNSDVFYGEYDVAIGNESK